MKKVALSFLALLAAASFAFAADLPAASPLTATVSATGAAKFGYDLDAGLYGLSNTADASIFLNFVGNVDSDSDANKTTGPDMGGKISANFRLGITSGAALEKDAALDYAKIVLGDLYIKIAGATNPSVNYADAITLFDGSLFTGTYGGTAASIKISDSVSTDPQTSTSGLEIGYSIPKTANITVGVGFIGDWTTAAAAQTIEYSAALDLTAVDKLTVGGSFVGGTATGANMGIGAKVGYDLGIVNLLAQVDYNLTSSSYGALIDVKLPLVKGLDIESATSYSTALDEGVKAVIGKDLLQIGSLTVGYQLSNTSVYADLELAPADGVAAWVKATMIGSTDLNAKVGATLSKLIPNVAFTAAWDSSNLVNSKLGLISLEAKIGL